MITVAEAFSILEKTIFYTKKADVLLWDARNHVLAETIYSPIDMPPFRQSNMDGYALALHDSLKYTIKGEIKAGDVYVSIIKPGDAVKIFTGAAVPDAAQAVIAIEKVSVLGNQLLLHEPVFEQANVRPKGSQILQNAVALEKGTLLNTGAIGFLAGLGFTSVKVYRKPSVGIVITGSELQSPGTPLQDGKVYESNGVMLKAALYDATFESVAIYSVNDDAENTRETLKNAIDLNDVVLVSGGISVGDYDFVGSSLDSLGVETLFHKVNQKPGKPLFVGQLNSKMIFALPGNPAAALTCFYIYVLPVLQKFAGIATGFNATKEMSLALDFTVSNSRSQFLKAVAKDDVVTILPHQDSSMLDSFALANALVYLPEGNYTKAQGDKVAVYTI